MRHDDVPVVLAEVGFDRADDVLYRLVAVAAARGDVHALPLRDIAAEQVLHMQHPVGVHADVDRVEPAADQELLQRVDDDGLAAQRQELFRHFGYVHS